MAKEVLLPKLSSTMDQGHVTQWFKNVGDPVKVGDVVFEVMTDKIAIEVEAYDSGFLIGRYVEVGEVVPVNTVIAHIGKADETVEKPSKNQTKQVVVSQPVEPTVVESPRVSTDSQRMLPEDGFGVRATPAARKAARERGITIEEVYANTHGLVRVQMKDVEGYRT
ncbi:MAG: hypothetical protein JXK92_00690, partial [Erysipelotrichaceae bacterium]|nr:hypothetical protein [Erysipelotrichaceae bacterium]